MSTGDSVADDPITVYLVDDHEVVRQGLHALLSSADDIEVVGAAGSVEMALAEVIDDPPDVLVLDVRLPDGSGIQICREVRSRHPEVAAVMLTSFADDEAVYESIMAGAVGYLLKEIRGVDLVEAVRRVAAGECLLDPGVTGQVLARLRGGDTQDPRLAALTDQERKILELVATGMINRAIGDELNLAEKTVKNYMSSILHKLEMGRRTEAAVFWTQAQQDGRAHNPEVTRAADSGGARRQPRPSTPGPSALPANRRGRI